MLSNKKKQMRHRPLSSHGIPIDRIPVPALALASDGTVTDANPAATRLLGVEMLDGRSFADFVTTESRSQVAAVINGQQHRAEMRMRRSDGTPFWSLVHASPEPTTGGIMAVLQEVTSQKLREEELRQGREEAEQEVRARMRFFASASHDLRQPLQAMALFISALENHVDKPQARNIFSSLKVSLKSMEEMFESLLDMSRLDAGVLKPNPAPFMIGDILERLETEFEAPAEQAGVGFRILPSSAAVVSDAAMLNRILRNFVSNAIRYTRSGGKVLVGCRRRGRTLRIEIWDSGVGISEDQLQEIFDEFYQGKTGEKRKGSGLGLAIVQRLARVLDHRLDVRSSEGSGSVFAVEVPISGAHAEPADIAEDATETRDVRGVALVVVDDDREVLEAIDLLVQEWGGTVITATTAEEALERVRAKRLRPDLILADYRLRTSEGGVSAIRALEKALGGNIPAFVFTGSTSDGSEIGEDYPVLRKPLQPERLKTVLADARQQH